MIETSGVRYLGSKNKILPHILSLISSLSLSSKTCIDVFTGTTRVAQALKQNGFDVLSSDLAWASECYADTFLYLSSLKHLHQHIDDLNQLEGMEGWLTKNYSQPPCEVWKKENTMKADAIRDRIEILDLSKQEKNVLITSLIFALDKVDNTIGIQQAYLKGWKSDRVGKKLQLILPQEVQGKQGRHICGDALKIEYPKMELAYVDPPYTPADYSTYYHIWDSIAKWDKPEVVLNTNRRIDRAKSLKEKRDLSMISPWYSKKTALKATKQLIERLPVQWIVFSYSCDGLISLDEMKNLSGFYQLEKIEHKRNVMTKIGTGANPKAEMKNEEYLLVYKKL